MIIELYKLYRGDKYLESSSLHPDGTVLMMGGGTYYEGDVTGLIKYARENGLTLKYLAINIRNQKSSGFIVYEPEGQNEPGNTEAATEGSGGRAA